MSRKGSMNQENLSFERTTPNEITPEQFAQLRTEPNPDREERLFKAEAFVQAALAEGRVPHMSIPNREVPKTFTAALVAKGRELEVYRQSSTQSE